MPDAPWIAALVALFVWWFSTGAILVLVRLIEDASVAARRLAVLVTLPVFVLGLYGVAISLPDASVTGAYLAFLSAIALWGWIEFAFLAGVITGPNRRLCPPDRPEWERFLRAWGTIAYHEMTLLIVVIALFYVSSGAEQATAAWTFAVLFFARVSAKLNLYLGVPHINVEFVPRPLAHLPSYFRKSKATALFPLSVTALTFAAACWLERAYAADTASDVVGFALLTAITVLALAEHWFMVVALPDQKLWRWMMPDRGSGSLGQFEHNKKT
jgi:putative photosynthetic complex assembly protein 2